MLMSPIICCMLNHSQVNQLSSSSTSNSLSSVRYEKSRTLLNIVDCEWIPFQPAIQVSLITRVDRRCWWSWRKGWELGASCSYIGERIERNVAIISRNIIRSFIPNIQTPAAPSPPRWFGLGLGMNSNLQLMSNAGDQCQFPQNSSLIQPSTRNR